MTDIEMLNPKAVMNRLGVSYPTLLRRVKANEIPYVKLGNKLLFPASYFLRLEEQAYANVKRGKNDE